MKSLFNKYIWLQLILSLLLMFAGALVLAFAISNKTNVLRDGVNIIAAVILFLFALFVILSAFIFEPNKPFTTGLLTGSICISIGIILCLGKFVLLDYLVFLLAIFFIVLGSVEILKGIAMIVQKFKNTTYVVFTFIAAAICITFGILALIFPSKFALALYIIAGILIFMAGAFELVLGIKAMVDKNNGAGKSKENHEHRPTKKEPKKEVKELDYTK